MKTSAEKDDIIFVMIDVCTRVVTMVFVVFSIVATLTKQSDSFRFTLRDVNGILFMGIISGVATGMLCLKNQVSKKHEILFQLIHFLILNSSLFIIGFQFEWIEKNLSSLISMEIIFVVVYIVVYLLVFIFNLNETKKINKKLKERSKCESGMCGVSAGEIT